MRHVDEFRFVERMGTKGSSWLEKTMREYPRFPKRKKERKGGKKCGHWRSLPSTLPTAAQTKGWRWIHSGDSIRLKHCSSLCQPVYIQQTVGPLLDLSNGLMTPLRWNWRMTYTGAQSEQPGWAPIPEPPGTREAFHHPSSPLNNTPVSAWT